jgi:hypothetical protein
MRHVLFDFTEASAVQGWRAIDDRVMGGISRSSLQHDPAGHAVFQGTVSLQRNGGFASVRSSPADRGQIGAPCCRVEVRGDPKPFKLSLFTDDGFDSVNYQTTFTPARSSWQTLDLPLSEFHPTFRGRAVPGAPPLEPARIRQVGLMIAAGQEGPFELHIRAISLA